MAQPSKREQRRQQEAKASLYTKYNLDKNHKVWISANDVILKFPNGLEITYPPFFFLALHIKSIVERTVDKKLSNEERNGAKYEISMLLSMIVRFEIDFQSGMEKKVKEHVEIMKQEALDKIAKAEQDKQNKDSGESKEPAKPKKDE